MMVVCNEIVRSIFISFKNEKPTLFARIFYLRIVVVVEEQQRKDNDKTNALIFDYIQFNYLMNQRTFSIFFSFMISFWK